MLDVEALVNGLFVCFEYVLHCLLASTGLDERLDLKLFFFSSM